MNHVNKSLDEMLWPLSSLKEAVLEAIPEIIMQVDVDKVYRWANRAGLEFFGDDVIGKEAARFFVGEAKVYETVREVFEGNEHVVRVESWQRRKDGVHRLLVWNCRALKDENGNVVGAISTARDMTEHRQREDYREISREILQRLNKPGDWQDMIPHIMEVLKTWTGFSAVGLRLRKGEDFPYFAQKGFPPDFLLKENICGLILSGKADVTSPFFTKGGSFWTNDSLSLLDIPPEQDLRYQPRNLCMQNGYASLALIPIRQKETIVGLLHLADQRKGCFTLEIVELLENVAVHIGESLMRRQAEEALETERLQLRTLIDNLPCGVFFKDTESRFVVVNQPLAHVVGEVTPNALMGRDDTAYHSAELARQFRDEETRILRDGVGLHGKEDWVRFANVSDPQCFATTKVPIKNNAGEMIGLVGFSIDITERKRMEVWRETGLEVMQCLNEPCAPQTVIQCIISTLKERTGFDAVGLCLHSGQDVSYYDQDGASTEFILKEKTLIERDANGEFCCSTDGDACVGCTRGLVMSGKTNPELPFFTKGGSFWTNNIIHLLDLSDKEGSLVHFCNPCIHDGYASVALIPIKAKERVIGLIHLNDRRLGRFTLQIVELLENMAAHMGEALMRKRTEAALQASEEQHRLLLQYLPVGVVVHAPDTSVLLANKQAELLLGISMEVMQGKIARDPVWQFVREDGSPMPLDEYPVSRVLATGKPIENVLLGVDRQRGSTRVWLLVNAFAHVDDAGQVRQVEVTFNDITERKRLEAALEQRLVALTLPLDQPEGITFTELFDLEAMQRIQDEFAAATGVASVITYPDGKPITRPSNFCRLCRDIIRNTELGCANCYHSDSIIGRHHPEGPIIQTCLSGGLWDAGASITIGNRHIANWLIGQVRDETQSEENIVAYARTIGADEAQVLAAYREVPAMSISHFQQIAQALFTLANQLSTTAYQNIQQARFISERRQAEVALETERLQLRALIDNLPYAVYVKDLDCRFLVANLICAQHMGVSSPEALMGHTDLQHHPEELARQYMEDDVRIMREGIGLFGKEEYVKIAGREELRCWSTTKVPLKDATGHVFGLVGIGIDITEHKAAEKAILDMAEAKSKFTSTVSHELRTPLAMIKEATNLVLEGVLGSLNGEQKEMLDITKSNVDRLGRMINNVLEYQKMEAGKTKYDLTKNDVNDLVKETNKGAVLFAGERKADIVMDLGTALPKIVLDHDKIMQVLINLLANAIKYSESGPVVIQTRLEKKDIHIRVQDSGQGIYPEEVEEIFSPFYQGKGRKKGGTGLGLAIAKEIILAHHGKIWVESEIGKGSTFHVALPVG